MICKINIGTPLTLALQCIIIWSGYVANALWVSEDVMARKVVKSLYGKIALLKGYCKHCGKLAFIIQEELQCCGRPLGVMPIHERIKRESETDLKRGAIPAKLKREILEQQDNKCIFCDSSFGSLAWNDKRKKYIKLKIHYDHFVPWVYSGDNSGPNISASCHICNSLKSDNHFYDLISAKEYLNAKRIRRGYV